MNTIIFSGKLIADARFVTSEKGNFISFTLFENGKGADAPKLDVTQNIKGSEAPKIVDYLKKFATVIVTGTPYAKTSVKDNQSLPVLCAFADKIEIVEFPKKAENSE
jgi:hypothetical protein